MKYRIKETKTTSGKSIYRPQQKSWLPFWYAIYNSGNDPCRCDSLDDALQVIEDELNRGRPYKQYIAVNMEKVCENSK